MLTNRLFPVLAKRRSVDGVTVVLRRDVAVVGTHEAHGLVVGAMTILQFVDGGSCGFAQQLVAHADATDRLAAHRDLLADDVDGSLTGIGVAGAVGQEQTIEVHVGIVVVPRHADNLHATVNETTDDIGLDTAVDEHHFLSGTLVVTDDALGGDLVDEVDTLIGGLRHIVGLVVEDDLAHHHAMFAEHLGHHAYRCP